MRLEQRIGRVDRIGQKRTVHAFHLIARDTTEARLLARLEDRLACAQSDIGAPDPLGMSEEAALARAAVGDDVPDVHFGSFATAPPSALDDLAPTRLVTPQLAAEARAEAQRIVRARALLRAGDEDTLARIDGRGPCLAVARRSKTRAVLGRRLLLLYRAGMEVGAAGARRTAASVLVPVAIDLLHRDLDMRNLLGRLDADIRRNVEVAIASWRQRTSEVHQAFIGTRLNRERALGTDNSGPTIFQAGLFDHRTENARLALAAAERDRHDERDAALAVFEQAGTILPTETELLLVLEP
jgi:hypothetical protein